MRERADTHLGGRFGTSVDVEDFCTCLLPCMASGRSCPHPGRHECYILSVEAQLCRSHSPRTMGRAVYFIPRFSLSTFNVKTLHLSIQQAGCLLQEVFRDYPNSTNWFQSSLYKLYLEVHLPRPFFLLPRGSLLILLAINELFHQRKAPAFHIQLYWVLKVTTFAFISARKLEWVLSQSQNLTSTKSHWEESQIQDTTQSAAVSKERTTPWK